MTLISSGRFVDRDMFMRYRGGGVGHKYMRSIETKYENMSIERDHWHSRSKPSRGNDMDVDAASDDERPEDPIGRSGSVGVDGDESEEDGDYVPPESGNSSDCSTGSDEDSDGKQSSNSEGDPDEVDDGYESYGLADL